MGILEIISVWLAGGLSYCGIELLWRGRTHWTMLVLGGICFFAMYLINTRLRQPLWTKWLMSACTVTALEFLSGCLLNLWLRWEVWSYSGLPWNLLGQICPLYAFFWFLLSIPGTGLSLLLRRCFHGWEAPSPSVSGAGGSRTTFPGGTAQARTRRERS